jgi:alkylhydroperoxidase family enzyme
MSETGHQSGSSSARGSRYAEVAARLPRIGRPFADLYRSFWTLQSVPPSTLELCRLRLAQLHGSDLAWQHQEVAVGDERRQGLRQWPGSDLFSPAEKACLELCEVHAMDARAITDDQADAVKAHYGEVGYVAVVQALGVFDAVIRLGLIWDLSSAEVD